MEAKYLIRSLEGKLRISLAEKTILTALAQSIAHATASKKNRVASPQQVLDAETAVKSVYSELPSYDVLVPALLEGGTVGLEDRCTLTPGKYE